MNTIQSVLLVSLGFLGASVLALLIAPAFWARAVRLTSRRIREQLPITEKEVNAEKDRLRAEHALHTHALEQQLEAGRLSAARQLIEINRREAALGQVRSEADRLKQELEEAQNARRVLEQTVADRLPRVEARLSEAKNLLHARDREIHELTRSAESQTRALGEAGAINRQHQAEIDRLLSALEARGAGTSGAASDARFDQEIALRSELEAVRAKARDQSALISRLQGQMSEPMLNVPRLGGPHGQTNGAAGAASEGPTGSETGAAQEAIAREQAVVADLEQKLRAMKSRNEDQSGEIARLRAALSVFEAGDDERSPSVRDSKIALRAKLGSVEALSAQQTETIQSLRAELAASNERMARQATHFMNEMRRLGAGTLPASGLARRQQTAVARQSLAERVISAHGEVQPSKEGTALVGADAGAPAGGQEGATAHAANGAGTGSGKPRLLDRITSISKSPQS